MQPKTAAKTKDNLEPSRENKKEILSSPAEQWDVLAFRLIQQELAPKGYSEIKRGPYRGSVQANIPFLRKQSVLNCQKIAAQMVRTYRAKVLKAINDDIKTAEVKRDKSAEDRGKCYFWQFREKKRHQYAYEHYRDRFGLLTIIKNEIENIGIK